MAIIVSTRITRLQAVMPRTQTAGLGAGLTTSWAEVQTRPANLAALSGSEALKNTDITIGADGRITGIGAGALKQVDNAGVSLSSSGQLTYSTPGGPVNIGSVLLSGLGAGSFAYLSALNSANIGSYIAASAIGSYYISDLAASKLTAGTLAAGVVYAGTLNASQINAGSLSADRIGAGTITADGLTLQSASGTVKFGSGTGQSYVNALFNANSSSSWALYITNGVFGAIGGFVLSGSSGSGGLSFANSSANYIYGGMSFAAAADSSITTERFTTGFTGKGNGAGHGVRGKSGNGASAGLVGANNGKAFHAEMGATGPFTGAHDVLLAYGEEIDEGDIVQDVSCVIRRDWSDTLFHATRTNAPNAKGVVGVFTRDLGPFADYAIYANVLNVKPAYDDFGEYIPNALELIYENVKDRYWVGEINALGEGQLNVCGEGGNLVAGDLIVTSSLPGKGMKQADDILRGYTVAKCREAVTFESPIQVKKIACIYLCG